MPNSFSGIGGWNVVDSEMRSISGDFANVSSFDDYYTIYETSGAQEIEEALDLKQNTWTSSNESILTSSYEVANNTITRIENNNVGDIIEFNITGLNAGEVPNVSVEFINNQADCYPVFKNGNVELYCNTDTCYSGKNYMFRALGSMSEIIEMYIPHEDPPTPSVNYVLLQNMVEGHSIGEPVDYNDDYGYGWHDHWVDTVLYEDRYHEGDYVWCDNYGDICRNYYIDNLLSTTVGDKTIDTRNPIDFSKYNINNGTPYAIYNGDDYSTRNSLTFDLTETLFNQKNTTLETWSFCRPDVDCDYYYTQGLEPLMYIGSQYYKENGLVVESFQLGVIIYSYNTDDDGITVAITYDGVASQDRIELFSIHEENGNFLNSGKSFKYWLYDWHHYALSIDGTNIYLHIDGKLVGHRALSDEISFTYTHWIDDRQSEEIEYNGTIEGIINQIPKMIQIGGRKWNEVSIDAGYAQIAVSDSCKWTTDFEVPTVAY